MLSVSSTVSGWGSSIKRWWRPPPPPPLPPPPALIQLPLSITREQAKQTALLMLAATGAASLLALALHRWLPRPFPRGRQSRAKNSLPFAESDVCPIPSVAHQFWRPEQYRFENLSHGRVRYILRSPSTSGAAGSSSPGVAAGISTADEFSLDAPGARPVVVLVHGFSIACDIWKQQSDYLVSRGYTVLCFDNYGRGWSDAPGFEVSYTEGLYVSQLAELLFALGIRRPVDLVGLSMGAAIAAAFAATHPQAVRRLGLVSPAGLPVRTPHASVSAFLLALPLGLGERVFGHFIQSMQTRGAAAMWERGTDDDGFQAWQAFAGQNVREHPGFVRALYRTVREFAMNDQRHNYAALSQATDEHGRALLANILIVWGTEDGLTPYANAAVLQKLLPGSRLVSVQGAKHNMILERPQEINDILEAWLKQPQKAHDAASSPGIIHTKLPEQQQQQQQLEGR